MKRFITFLTIVFFIFASASFALADGYGDSNKAKAQSGASIEFTDNSEAEVIDRDFVGSSPAVTAGTHALFLKNTGDDVSFRRVQELIKYGSIFSEDSLRALRKGSDIEGHFTAINNFAKPDVKQSDGERYIMIVTIEPKGFRMAAPFDKEADDKDTNSFALIADAALDALDNGDNILFVEFEGWKDKVHAGGWGIGTHTAAGTISDSGKASGVGGGGFGISANEVGEEKQPWIRGYSGCIPTMLSISDDILKMEKTSKNRTNDGFSPLRLAER